MWASVIAIGFAVGALLTYFNGAREGKPWGTPLLAVMVSGAVVSVVLPQTSLWEKIRPQRERYKSMRMLGETLRDDLSSGARVFIIRHKMNRELMRMEMGEAGKSPAATLEGMIEEKQEAVKAALERGLGYNVEIVGFVPPGLTDSYQQDQEEVKAFNEVLALCAERDVDACISRVGIPGNTLKQFRPENVAFNELPSDTVLVAEMALRYVPDVLRNLIADGKLHAAVIHPSRKSPKQIVITRDNLKQLPVESPW